MTSSKSTKRALVLSVCSIMLCFVIAHRDHLRVVYGHGLDGCEHHYVRYAGH